MKLFVTMLCVAMFVLVGGTSAGAIQLGAGESATFSFDFSSTSPLPPYNDFHLTLAFDVLTSDGEVYVDFFDDLTDPNGTNWSTVEQAWSFYTPPFLLQTVLDNSTARSVTTTLEFATVRVTSGTLGDPALALAMSVNGELTDILPGQPISQVPEPTTMLLLGSGLLGLWGFRKKFQK